MSEAVVIDRPETQPGRVRVKVGDLARQKPYPASRTTYLGVPAYEVTDDAGQIYVLPADWVKPVLEIRKCGWCGTDIDILTRHGPDAPNRHQYCSRACVQAAYRDRWPL